MKNYFSLKSKFNLLNKLNIFIFIWNNRDKFDFSHKIFFENHYEEYFNYKNINLNFILINNKPIPFLYFNEKFQCPQFSLKNKLIKKLYFEIKNKVILKRKRKLNKLCKN